MSKPKTFKVSGNRRESFDLSDDDALRRFVDDTVGNAVTALNRKYPVTEYGDVREGKQPWLDTEITVEFEIDHSKDKDTVKIEDIPVCSYTAAKTLIEPEVLRLATMKREGAKQAGKTGRQSVMLTVTLATQAD